MKTTTLTRDGRWVMFEETVAGMQMTNSVDDRPVRMSRVEGEERIERLRGAGWR